jgi:HPt (histidine-containing phosphotransfer) domain-containing protein
VPNLDPHIPIIALCPYATELDRQKCLAAGMDDFVTKPVRIEDLQAALERGSAKPNGLFVARYVDNPDVPVTLDRAQFDHLCGLQDDEDPEFICDLIDLFLVETPRRIEELRVAFRSGDLRTIEHVSHTIKGAAANLGARALHDHCQRIEFQVREGRLAKGDKLLSGLTEEFSRLAKVLEKQKQRVSVENPRR